jgi:F0F1-type ATP synthase membrane subunit b/b'
MKLFIFVISLLPLYSYSAGDGHHSSPMDLIPPVVNVSILVGFLVYKLKKPLNDHFKSKAQSIKESVERASIKTKEAEMLLDMNQKKLANIENEIKEIHKFAEDDVLSFSKTYAKEIEIKSEKLKVESVNTLDTEKKAMLNKLSEDLLDEVIAKTKQRVKKDNNLNKQATDYVLGSFKQ